MGYDANNLLEASRSQILSAFKLSPSHQLVFLSGATEANNLALKGVGFAYENRGKKILVSAVEHPSVLATAYALRDKFGFEVVVLPVNEDGVVLPQTLEEAMDSNVILVSIMGVNNETGSENDLLALSKIVHHFPKAFFHSDLTQAIGKTPVDYSCLDLFSFSGHKIHGLKGVGALVFKKNMKLFPSIHGGGHENGYRSGTVAHPLAASLATCVQYSLAHQDEARAHAEKLNHALWESISDLEVARNSPLNGSPFILNFSLLRHKASVVVEALSQKGIYVSSVSACSSKKEPVSSVLLAMGKDNEKAANAVRVSFDESNSLDEVALLSDTLRQILKEVRPR